MKISLIGTGLSGMVGERFRQLFDQRINFTNLDITTGVDITNEQTVKTAIRDSQGDVVLHLAAFTNVSAAHEQKGDKNGLCYQINVTGTRHIARYCQQFNKYLIHVSTDFVFDGNSPTPYTETDTPNPIEWYGQTKLWSEAEVSQAGGDHVILRITYPYQAKPVRPDFLTTIIDKLTSDSLPPAFTNHIITPTFADDICQVFWYCVNHRPTGLYHAVGSSFHSDYEIATMVKETFNLPGTVTKGDVDEYIKQVARPYQKNMRTSNQKLTTDFGISMKKFAEGLEIIKRQLG